MKEFQTESFRMKISDDLIKEITIKSNVVFSSEHMHESLRISSNAFKPDTKFFVLLDGEEGADVAYDAKRLAASEEYKKYTAALALYSKSPLQAISGNLFLNINKPKIPTRFFDKREDALIWLKNLASNTQK
jgi:hypothetical protein